MCRWETSSACGAAVTVSRCTDFQIRLGADLRSVNFSPVQVVEWRDPGAASLPGSFLRGELFCCDAASSGKAAPALGNQTSTLIVEDHVVGGVVCEEDQVNPRRETCRGNS